MKVLCVFLIFCLTCALGHQWIDPHDMNTKEKEKYMKPKPKTSSGTYDKLECPEPMADLYQSYLKRLISVLINSAYVNKRDTELYQGHIRFNINPSEFDFLQNFGKDQLNIDKLRRLDDIVSESFKRTYVDEYLDIIEEFQVKLYKLVLNIQNLWLFPLVFLLYVVYQLFKNDFSFAYILKYLIIIVLAADFGLRYQYLLEEAEEHNVMVVYSKECDTGKMSWAEWTTYLFSSRNCEKKTVTPLDAFLYQIKSLIIVPMHALGTGMGGFGKNMFTTLPWGLNMIMWPIMLIFSLICLIFFMTICTGQPIEFNIFHLVKLKFGGDSQKGPKVERIENSFVHRIMVQNVPPEPQKCQNCENPLSIERNSNENLLDNQDKKCKTTDKGTNTAYVCQTKADLEEPEQVELLSDNTSHGSGETFSPSANEKNVQVNN